MSEIKSTLDLVMERTRLLSMSAEEKSRQQQADSEKRRQGLLRQYADGAPAVDALQDRIRALQAALQVRDRAPVLAAVVDRNDPEADSRAWMDLPALRRQGF